MRVPSTLRVVGEDWTIKKQSLPSDDVRGYCDGVKRRITLDPDTSGREDLLHELIHAIENAFNLSLEEAVVQTIARSLWQIAQDNPEFIEYLSGGNE